LHHGSFVLVVLEKMTILKTIDFFLCSYAWFLALIDLAGTVVGIVFLAMAPCFDEIAAMSIVMIIIGFFRPIINVCIGSVALLCVDND